MSRFRYPVDTDQFDEIREKGLVYVDKTDLLFDIVNRYKYVFLARPRRFGKSLLCNTFKAYFQGQKELFEGLKIMELEKEWKTYPVLHFIMSGLKNLKVDDSVDNALAQIDSKGYAIPYEADGRKVTKCGVSISSEARNIVHWRAVDEEGNVIDEQKLI